MSPDSGADIWLNRAAYLKMVCEEAYWGVHATHYTSGGVDDLTLKFLGVMTNRESYDKLKAGVLKFAEESSAGKKEDITNCANAYLRTVLDWKNVRKYMEERLRERGST